MWNHLHYLMSQTQRLRKHPVFLRKGIARRVLGNHYILFLPQYLLLVVMSTLPRSHLSTKMMNNRPSSLWMIKKR